jgi:hypothetical protein
LKLVREGFEPLEVSRTVDDEAVWHYDMPTSTTTWTLTSSPDDALFDGPGKERDGGKFVVPVGGKKSVTVKLQRPGCHDHSVSLLATGKPEAEQRVVLDCGHKLDAFLEIHAPRGTRVSIDGVDLPKNAKLDKYALPSGTVTVRLRSPRGKVESQTVELTSNQTQILSSKLK